MKSRIRTQKKRTREQIQEKTAQAKPMFQSRPFVVQSQKAEQSKPHDLKSSLRRAERYGHHLSLMNQQGASVQRAVQQKEGREQKKEKQAVQRAGEEKERAESFSESEEMESNEAEEEFYEDAKVTTLRIKSLMEQAVVKSEQESVEKIVKKVSEIAKIGTVVKVAKTRNEFIAAMAEDLAHKDGHKLESSKYEVEAARQLEENEARGYTDYKSRIWLPDPYNVSDLMHECVHVLSAKGGQTELKNISSALNEGFTQYFTKQVCQSMGIQVVEAYPEEVKFVEDLAATYGMEVLKQAYFQGQVEELLSRMEKRYVEEIEKAIEGKKQPNVDGIKYSEREIVSGEEDKKALARKNLIERLKEFKTTGKLWLKIRVLKEAG